MPTFPDLIRPILHPHICMPALLPHHWPFVASLCYMPRYSGQSPFIGVLTGTLMEPGH